MKHYLNIQVHQKCWFQNFYEVKNIAALICLTQKSTRVLFKFCKQFEQIKFSFTLDF